MKRFAFFIVVSFLSTLVGAQTTQPAYVSPVPLPSGSWASRNAPTTARSVYVSASSQYKTLNSALAWAGDGTAIYLKRGETFKTPKSVINRNNIIVGAYGDVNLPLPRLVGEGSSAPTSDIITVKGQHVRVEHINFDDNSATKFTAIGFESRDGTVFECEVTNRPDYFVIARPTSVGTRVFGNRAPQGTYKYFAYTNAYAQYFEVENNFCPDTKYENLCRTHAIHFRIIGNRFGKSHQDPLHGVFQIREGDDGYIGYNVLNGDTQNPGMQICLGPLASEPSKFLRHIVFERNHCNQLDQFQLFAGLEDFLIRDSYIDRKTGTVFHVMPSSVSRPPPQGRVENTKLIGGSLFSGNASKIVYKNCGNTFNGQSVN